MCVEVRWSSWMNMKYKVTHLIINGYSVITGEMECIAHEDEYEKEMT